MGQQGENFIRYMFPKCMGETSCLCVLHGFQMGGSWTGRQRGVVGCTICFGLGTAATMWLCLLPWGVSLAGWAGGARTSPISWPCALAPSVFPKEALCLVCSLQCRSKPSEIPFAFQLGGAIKYLFAKKGQNRPHLLNTPAHFLQITFSWGYLPSAA